MNNDEKFSLTARSGIRASSFFRYSPFVTRHSGLIRSLVLGAWCFSGAWMLELGASAATLELRLAPTFNSRPLAFDTLSFTNAAGQTLSVTRLDLLLSDFALRRPDGSWLAQSNWQAYLGLRDGRTACHVANRPEGRYDRVRFRVGLRPDLNHADPAQFPSNHPLNPNVNRLHWSWQGGYVFLALEGRWADGALGVPPVRGARYAEGGYAYHLATDRQLMTVELPLALELTADSQLDLALDLDKILALPNQMVLSEATASTHSRTNDTLAIQLRQNIQTAFAVTRIAPFAAVLGSGAGVSPVPGNGAGVSPVPGSGAGVAPVPGSGAGVAPPTSGRPALEIAPNATPYRLTISSLFPRPSLPLDNPLTEEGVGLGRLLFNDKRLSVNNSQSCASCHDLTAAGADKSRAFSLGAEGKTGTRNAMPLFNLAWKSAFFWDGRAATLRNQVLMPIQNPLEMHETLTNVISKLCRSRREEALTEKTPNSKLQPPEKSQIPSSKLQENPKSQISTVAAGVTTTSDTTGPSNGTDYPYLFARAFGTPEITADRLARALEQFLLTQVSHDSKFDRVLKGEAKFTDAEQRGFELFHTEYDPRHEQFGADCFHCHGGLLFQSQNFANNGLDFQFKDLGRYETTKREGDQGKFAVPSLRNVEVTGPYMHDGRFQTLEEVVEHYTTGVKRTATVDPNLAKHPDGGVPLSQADKQGLVAFLKTLTDEQFRHDPSELAKTP
jgi:cytochrome c peroxidase